MARIAWTKLPATWDGSPALNVGQLPEHLGEDGPQLRPSSHDAELADTLTQIIRGALYLEG